MFTNICPTYLHSQDVCLLDSTARRRVVPGTHRRPTRSSERAHSPSAPRSLSEAPFTARCPRATASKGWHSSPAGSQTLGEAAPSHTPPGCRLAYSRSPGEWPSCTVKILSHIQVGKTMEILSKTYVYYVARLRVTTNTTLLSRARGVR